MSKLKEEKEKLKEKTDKSNIDRAKIEEKIAELEKNNEINEILKKDAEEKYNKAKADLEIKKAELKKIMDENPDYDPDLDSKIDSKEKEFKKLESEISDFETKIQNLEGQKKNNSELIKQKTKEIERLESEINAEKTKLDKVKADLSNLNDSLERAKAAKKNHENSKKDNAVNAAQTGEKVPNFDKIFKDIEAEIQAKKAEQASIEGKINQLSSKQNEEKNASSNLSLENQNIGKEIQNLKASVNEKKTQAGQVQKELDGLEKQLQNKPSKDLLDKIEDLKKEIKELENKVAGGETAIGIVEQSKEIFEKGLKENKELVKDFIALDELDKKIEKFEKDIEDIKNAKKETQKRVEELKKAKEEQENLLEKAKKDLQAEEEENLKNIQNSIEEKQNKLKAVDNKDQAIKDLEEEKAKVQEKIDANKKEIEELEKEKNASKALSEKTANEIKTLKEKLLKLEEEKMGLASAKPMAVSLEQVKLDKKAIEDRIKEIDAQIKKLDIEIKNLRDEIANKKLLLATLEQKPIADTIDPILPKNKIKVKNIEKLTEKEQEEIKNNIEKLNKDNFPKGTQVEVDEKGNVTITYPDNSKDTINASDLVEKMAQAQNNKTDAQNNPAVIPAKTLVKDKNNLTDKEKAEIASKVKKSNPKAINIEVIKNGSVTITYPDGSKNMIDGSKLVSEKAKEITSNSKKAKLTPANNKTKNVKTGVGSSASILTILAGSVGGLFVSKKRKK